MSIPDNEYNLGAYCRKKQKPTYWRYTCGNDVTAKDFMEKGKPWITLNPEDLISTGTPPRKSALKPGDIVKAEIKAIGRLKNHVK